MSHDSTTNPIAQPYQIDTADMVGTVSAPPGGMTFRVPKQYLLDASKIKDLDDVRRLFAAMGFIAQEGTIDGVEDLFTEITS